MSTLFAVDFEASDTELLQKRRDALALEVERLRAELAHEKGHGDSEGERLQEELTALKEQIAERRKEIDAFNAEEPSARDVKVLRAEVSGVTDYVAHIEKRAGYR